MSHTPGPWRIRAHIDRGDDLKGTETVYSIAAGAEKWEKNKGHFHPDDAMFPIDEIEVVDVAFDRDYGCSEGGVAKLADARLIAEAPAMFAALLKFGGAMALPATGASEADMIATLLGLRDETRAIIARIEDTP